MSSNFDKFRALQISNEQALDKVAVKFVTNGLPSILITDLTLDIEINAAIVYNNDEFKDSAIIYVEEENELDVGSFIEIPDGDKFLIIDKELIAKHVIFKKYLAIRCNMTISSTA